MTEFESALLDMRPVLRAYAIRLTRNQSTAEDLVQDTLVKALRNSEQFALGTDMRAWTCTIMKNLHISALRRQRRWVVLSSDPEFKRLSTEPTQIESLYTKEVLETLSMLPDILRVPLEEAVLGKSSLAIADQLSIPEGTAKSRVRRARIRLNNNLAGK